MIILGGWLSLSSVGASSAKCILDSIEKSINDDDVDELSSKFLVPSIVGSLFRNVEALSAITPHGCRNACLEAETMGAIKRKAIPIDRNILVVLNVSGELVLF